MKEPMPGPGMGTGVRGFRDTATAISKNASITTTDRQSRSKINFDHAIRFGKRVATIA